MASSKQFDWNKHIDLMEENIKLKKDVKDLMDKIGIMNDMLFMVIDKDGKGWKGMKCIKHDKVELDCWYDCEECCEEAQKWAEENDYTQCVSPYNQEEGTDKGQWVHNNCFRWVRYGNNKETN